MLALKLGLSLNTIKTLGGWNPTDETSVVAWYKQGTGITSDPSTKRVSAWNDSANNHHMLQADATEQPLLGTIAPIGIVFNGVDENLGTSVQMSFSGAFTVGIRLITLSSNAVLLADNTLGQNEFFKFTSTTILRVKIDGVFVNLPLASGTFGDGYIVVTRDSSNNMGLWHNGVDQNVTATLAGTADIDTIGVRAVDINPFNGTMHEIQIFESESTALTANINTRLATL